MELEKEALAAAYSAQIQNLYNVFTRSLRQAGGDPTKEQQARERLTRGTDRARQAFAEASDILGLPAVTKRPRNVSKAAPRTAKKKRKT
ncbi:MAG: hypothetical protein AAF458_21490 [Pseudomonadota bacterium]